MFPTTIGMPMPEKYNLYCFENWLTRRGICRPLRSSADADGELVYGDDVGLEWDDLIPQVVWRGTDFSYLTKVHPLLHKPEYRPLMVEWPFMAENAENRRTETVGGGLTARTAEKKQRRLERVRKRAPRRAAHSDRLLHEFNKAAAVKFLMEKQYRDLLPRWKAALLTAEAEVEAQAIGDPNQWGGPDDPNNRLPWANMKFSSFMSEGSKSRTQGTDHYREWESIGFATGEYFNLKDLAKYKYQIDLGGGGGTTWSGTWHKLAMPGE